MTSKSTNQPFILGLDLDGVCANYTAGLAEYVSREKGIDPDLLPEPEHYSYFESGWPFTSEDDYRACHGRAVEQGLFRWVRPMPGLKDAVDELHDNNVHVFIVTHRLLRPGSYARVLGDTAAWLDSHGIRYDSFSATRLKALVEVDIYVDDSPSNVASIRSAGTPALIFNQPYNQDVEGPRADDWPDAVKKILEFKAFLGK